MEASTALEEFLKYCLARIIRQPDKASMRSELVENGEIVFHVQLEEEDVARVIGKKGYTIGAIRNVFEAGAVYNECQASIKVYKNGEEEPRVDIPINEREQKLAEKDEESGQAEDSGKEE